jgi:hypothetical protein
MKTLLVRAACAVLVLCSTSLNAQHIRCSTNDHEMQLQAQHPKRAQQRLNLEQRVRQFASGSQRSMPNVTIPVVVHVVYSNNAQNISNAQIQSQIDVLNEDFNRLNADTVNTPAPWQSIAGSAGITFCLAQTDPNGAPTNGIERRQTTVNSFNTNDNIKSFASGGLDAWDPTQYFNIWVGNLGNLLLGYAEFPTTALSNTYGVVIHYNYFGRDGSAASPYDKGRTATHEVGHCFGLYHIWGDDGGACTGSDQVADTPPQAGEYYGCPAYPQTDNCSPTAPGAMFMNYMDYTDDACMNLFTLGQAARANATFNSSPYVVLQNSTACGTANLFNNDAQTFSIQAPSGTLCSGTVNPAITLRNAGADTLTSVDILYFIDNNPPQTYSWTGSLAPLTSTPVILPALTAANGSHTFSAICSLPNGQADPNAGNDSAGVAFSIVGVGNALPYAEGFETSFPPVGTQLNNPDNLTTFEQTTAAFHTGSKSMYINNYDYNSNGQVDELVLPNLDLTGVSNPRLAFWLAYRLYTNPTSNPNFSDTLTVQVSADCGQTWTEVYRKFGTALVTTASPVYTLNAFVPTAAQWRRDSVDLSPYATLDNVVVKFRHITDYENNLYIDDINIDGGAVTTGFGNSLVSGQLSVSPNPAHDRLSIHLGRLKGVADLRVYDLKGRLIDSKTGINSGGAYELNISTYSAGTYMGVCSAAGEMFRFTFVKD